MQRALIWTGLAIMIAGVLWPWLSRIPFGRLPGDIVINRPQVKVFIPVTTMILISVLLTLILHLIHRR